MSEPLQVRVVRTILRVAPRELLGSDVVDAHSEDKSGSVYATLSALTKDGKGPIAKVRSNGGVWAYKVAPDFDVHAWLHEKTAVPRAPKAAAPASDDDGIEIVRVVAAFKKRVTADEIYGGSDKFTDPRLMRVELAKLCMPGGPIERDHLGNGSSFVYGIRRAFDVEAWLKERGAEPVSISSTSIEAPKKDTTPSTAAAPVIRTSVPPCASSAPRPAAVATSQQPAGASPGALNRTTGSTPARPAEKPALNDLATELLIVAAANLAAAVRDAKGFDAEEPVVAALHTFYRAYNAQNKTRGSFVT